ncbi:MAG: fibrobacter succinogenes major paralogous domain-containing protein [Bacteroidales bacterium]|jgi:uncharacterized protein (TIGR02145 family)
MKKLFTILAAVLLTAPVWAQSPEKMSYQAVIRNSSEALVTNQAVGMQISILQGSTSGTAVYVETQTPTTNDNGLVSIEIGAGTVVSGNFATIDWANGPYFIKTETDLNGGANYTITGTSQLLSVPYALHAKTAETISGGITETDPVFGSSVASGITGTDTTNWNNKLDSYTETDPVFGTSVAGGITGTDTAYWNNKLDSYTETDPVFGTSVAGGITGTDTAYWNNKLDSYTETDPTVPAHVKAITTDNILDWNEAHGWGDHSAEGYATKDMNGEKITNLADPTDAQDAATKAYVDGLLARIEALEEKDLLNNGFTDTRDNNHYNVVKIGNQIWMAENLKYLPSVVGPGTGSQTTPYYYVYGYSGTTVADAKATANYTTYGVLYNWSAAMNGAASSTTNPSGIQGVCPTGWHLPSDAEWTELTDYLGGESVAGGKLKETGTTHWASPNFGATNETGFTALPGGVRNLGGTFNDIGLNGFWWSATEYDATNAWYRCVNFVGSNVNSYFSNLEVGFSVRCLRD